MSTRLCFSCADGRTEATQVCDVPKTTGGTVEMFLCDYHAPMALIAWGCVPRAIAAALNEQPRILEGE